VTQEDKILLLTDLCARLPYNVKVRYDRIPPPGWKMSDTHVDGYLSSIEPNWSIANGYQPQIICSGTLCGIGDVRSYLRPMSEISNLISAKEFTQLSGIELIDWYNANHIDYRGLIEKNLAIKAPKDMYK